MVHCERAWISILYHAIENTVDNTMRHMVGWMPIPSNIQRLSSFLIGCISYMTYDKFCYYALIEMMMVQYDTER